MIDALGIRDLLPHRYPMLLVDRVIQLVPGERIVAIKAVSCNEPWYSRLTGELRSEHMAYPVALLIESWAQSAGLLVVAEESTVPAYSVMLFGSATNVTYLRSVYPGDVLEHRIRLSRKLTDTLIVEGETHVDGELVMTVGQGLMAFRPAGQLRSTS